MATGAGLVDTGAFRYNIYCRSLCRKRRRRILDNWNRKDQNEYTGITAQRRNRRRTGTGAEPAKPEMPPRAETPDLSVWKRPVTPEASAEPEAPVKPEIPEEAEIPAAPEAAEEPEKPPCRRSPKRLKRPRKSRSRRRARTAVCRRKRGVWPRRRMGRQAPPGAREPGRRPRGGKQSGRRRNGRLSARRAKGPPKECPGTRTGRGTACGRRGSAWDTRRAG